MENPTSFRARESSVYEREIMETAHQKAEQVFRHEIDMGSFAAPHGNYDREMVERDAATVDKLKAKYHEQLEGNQALADVKRISDVFEGMMADQIKKNNWFGGNTELIATSEYDDFVNHVDGILYFKVPGANDYLALGTDVTFSRASVEEKVHHIKKGIAEGRIARAKYFELPDGSFKGEIKDIPHIILGAEAKSVIQMAEQWVSDDGGKYLAKHWMQAQLLDMAITQCRAFKVFAEERGNQSAMEKYAYMEEKITRIRAMREKLGGKMPEDRDAMYKTLMDVLGGKV